LIGPGDRKSIQPSEAACARPGSKGMITGKI
jgi:hypothetical protein